jgi:hypothetical protein
MMKLNQVLFKDKEATFTSGWVDVSFMSRLTLQVAGSSISGGNGKFEVEVSNDGGTTVTTLKRLISNVTAGTVVDSLTISANGNDILFLPTDVVVSLMRVKVTRTTNGKYTASISGN